MKKQFVIGAIAVIVLVVSGIWLLINMSTQKSASSEHVSSFVKGDENDVKATIAYRDEGFTPKAVQVAVGHSVRIVNDSTIQLELAVGTHPAHDSDSELGVPVLAPGESVVVKMEKVGVKYYHNHIRPDHTGSLTVEDAAKTN